MAKLKIGDIEHDVPEAVAAHLQSVSETNAKLSTEARAAAEAIGRAKAETDGRLAAEADAKRKLEQDALIKKGEFDKAIDLERNRVKTVADKFRDAELRSLAASHPKLRKTGLDDAARAALIDDVVSQLRGSASFDLDRGQIVIQANGQPVEPKAHLDAFLTARPYLLEPNTANGSGADPAQPGGTGTHGTPQRSKMTVTEKSKFVQKHGQDAYFALSL